MSLPRTFALMALLAMSTTVLLPADRGVAAPRDCETILLHIGDDKENRRKPAISHVAKSGSTVTTQRVAAYLVKWKAPLLSHSVEPSQRVITNQEFPAPGSKTFNKKEDSKSTLVAIVLPGEKLKLSALTSKGKKLSCTVKNSRRTADMTFTGEADDLSQPMCDAYLLTTPRVLKKARITGVGPMRQRIVQAEFTDTDGKNESGFGMVGITKAPGVSVGFPTATAVDKEFFFVAVPPQGGKRGPTNQHLLVTLPAKNPKPLQLIALDRAGKGCKPETPKVLDAESGTHRKPVLSKPKRSATDASVSPDRASFREAGGIPDSFVFGNPLDVPFVGDWDCDGIDTPGAFRPSENKVYLRDSNTAGTADVSFELGAPGDVPLAGDFDGNGCDSVSVWRPSQATVFVVNETRPGAPVDVEYTFGNPGDVPFVGDFDGDGVDTIGLHRPGTGAVMLRQDHRSGVADRSFIFGNPGDLIYAGDWTGDGIDTVAAYRPSTNTLYLRHENSRGAADETIPLNFNTWLPTPVSGHFGP